MCSRRGRRVVHIQHHCNQASNTTVTRCAFILLASPPTAVPKHLKLVPVHHHHPVITRSPPHAQSLQLSLLLDVVHRGRLAAMDRHIQAPPDHPGAQLGLHPVLGLNLGGAGLQPDRGLAPVRTQGRPRHYNRKCGARPTRHRHGRRPGATHRHLFDLARSPRRAPDLSALWVSAAGPCAFGQAGVPRGVATMAARAAPAAIHGWGRSSPPRRPRHTLLVSAKPCAMSELWFLGVLVPSACLSLWCLSWCCFGVISDPPASPRATRRPKRVTFQYNPVNAESPRADSAPLAKPVSPTSPPVIIVADPPRTLPGLHFIYSASIND